MMDLAAARQRAEVVLTHWYASGRGQEHEVARDLLAVLDENTRLREALTEISKNSHETPRWITRTADDALEVSGE